MFIRFGLIVVLVVIVFAMAAGVSGATVIPDEKEHVVLLDGQWHFKIEQSDTVPAGFARHSVQPAIRLPKQFEPFQMPDYHEGGRWHEIAVPGNWEMFGYCVATYFQPDNTIGIYRHSFEVPADWKGRIVKLNFDGVQYGAEIYLNGKPVNVDEPWGGRANYHEGGYNSFQADLTEAVKFGQSNLLAVRVYKNTNSINMDSGDYFMMGGIQRSVTLFTVEPAHIEDLSVRTHLLEGGKAELRVLLEVEGAVIGSKVSVQLEGESAVAVDVNTNGTAEIVQILEHPRLWSAEKPNLYELSVNRLDARGVVREHITRRIGIREVSIKDGVLLVNGAVVKLTGICRHELDPALGAALNETVWKRDLTLMKAANINAVRTSHYPYAAGFYDLCDEMGFYVADEMAACWVPTDTDALTPAFTQHAREMVRRDKNHPSVIMWCVGNENRPGKNNRIAADEIRRLDPTRPRLVSIEKPELTGVELDDSHYVSPGQLEADVKDPRRKIYPKPYLENPNVWEERNGADYGCLDLWVNVMDRAWREIWNDDHMSGSFLWEWRDRAIADPGPEHLYDYDPVTGINLVKVKGICDGFGNPRADYYHVKVVYAPIKIDLKPKVDGSTIVVHAVNHLSFTDVAELSATWHLLKDGAELAHAVVHPALAPNSSGDLTFELPADAIAKADALRLDFDHSDGLNIVTYQLRLTPEKVVAPTLDSGFLANVPFPHLNFITINYGANHDGYHWAFRHPGHLANILIHRAGGNGEAHIDEKALSAMPISDISSMSADVLLADGKETVAQVHTDFGAGKFDYQFKWNGAKDGDILEAGWAFAVGKQMDHFSWHRQGYWSWYPENHIGRLAGTALPDTADVHVTKITRPDAFDFNSTKYNCDWASLTDSAGHGLAVVFAADNRHQCRGDFVADGGYELVVNKQVSPPEDISSSVVPDLYLKLKQNQELAGSFTVGSR